MTKCPVTSPVLPRHIRVCVCVCTLPYGTRLHVHVVCKCVCVSDMTIPTGVCDYMFTVSGGSLECLDKSQGPALSPVNKSLLGTADALVWSNLLWSPPTQISISTPPIVSGCVSVDNWP